MDEFFIGWTGLEKFFLLCAIFGGVVFIFKLALQFIGADTDLDGGVDMGHVDTGHLDHADSDLSFKILSLQGLTAFFMMFGLTGLTIARGFGLGALIASVGATAVGLGTAWVIAKLMTMMIGMQSSGTLDVKNAVGQEGTVYLTIPADGIGKVQIDIQNRLQEFEAVSNDNTEIKTGKQIKVVFLRSDILVVEKI